MTVPPARTPHCPTRLAAHRSPARRSTVPERMIVAPGRRHLPPARRRRRRRAQRRRRDRRRRGPGHQLPGAQPVRWHADGHAGAPRRTPALRPADRVVASRVSGLPVSVVGWGTAVPDGRVIERRPRSARRHERRVDRRAHRHPRAPHRRPGRDRRRRSAPRPRPTRSSAPGSSPTDIDLLDRRDRVARTAACRTPARSSATRSGCGAGRST